MEDAKIERTARIKWLVISVFAVVFVCLLMSGKTEVKAAGHTGLAEMDGVWYLWQDGQVNYGYNGLYNDPACGWWLVQDGRVAFEYNDLYCDAVCGWWKVSGGAVDFGYTDLYYSPTCGWWKVNGGSVDFGYTDLYYSPTCGWWKVSGGSVDFGYTDLYCSPTCGWWKVNGGSVEFGYTDLYCSPTCGWWKVNGGSVDFGYTDLYESATCGWWLIDGGAVAFHYSDIWNSGNYGAWKVNGGSVDFGYTGRYQSSTYGNVYVSGGYADLSGNSGTGGNDSSTAAAAFPYTNLAAQTEYRLKADNRGKYYLCNSRDDIVSNYNGLYVDGNKNYWLVYNGWVNVDYTGVYNTADAESTNRGKWYVRDGKVDKSYTAMISDRYGKWYCENGQFISASYVGPYCTATNGWCYFQNGALNTYFNGLAECGDGIYRYFENGVFKQSYSGVFYDAKFAQNGTYYAKYISNGVMSTDFTGIAKNSDDQWVYFKNGCDTNQTRSYTGMAYDIKGKVWRYFTYGKINTKFTGMARNTDGKWYYYTNGVWDSRYEGIGRCTENGKYYTWYIKNGTIDKSYSGRYVDGIVTYQVTRGSAKAIDSKTPLLGVFFNSREDVTDTLYISFDGYEFMKISEAYTDAYPNDANNDLAVSSPYFQEGDADWKINTIHDPNIRYYNGAFWIVGGYVSGDKYIPLIGYSTDLVNWSYPSVGTASNGVRNTGLVPTTIPLAQDGTRTNSKNYHAVAQELFFDDNGDAYLTVSLGYYADNSSNKLTTYITKLSNLNYPANSNKLTTVSGKKEWSDKITVDYGPLVEMNLPGWDKFSYDCSLYKENGKYYYTANYDGEEVVIYSIDDLSKVGTKSAWTRVNGEAVRGYEGPYINKYNGEYFMYIDRFTDWREYHDAWEGQYFTFASTANSLNQPFDNYVHIHTIDKNGKEIKNRHGSVITLTGDAAEIAKQLYNSQY